MNVGELHRHGALAGGRSRGPNQTGVLGAGHALGDRSPADQAVLGDLGGGEPVGRAGAAQRGEQVEGRAVDVQLGQHAVEFLQQRFLRSGRVFSQFEQARTGGREQADGQHAIVGF